MRIYVYLEIIHSVVAHTTKTDIKINYVTDKFRLHGFVCQDQFASGTANSFVLAIDKF